ncbi:putative cytochrome P450 [Helianthus annuus]|nr:putative cytochrome P450 [Helianthus annuus]
MKIRLSTITFISLLITFIWFSSTLNPVKNRPPPRKLPIIGNLHQLGSNPHHALQTVTNKHGSLVLIHLGSVPVLVASSAEQPLSIPDTLTYGSKNIAFAPYGEHWRRVRSIAVLQLLSNKRVQSFRQVREQETHVIIDEIGKSCGSVIDLGELLNLLTNNVICRVALGRTYESKKFNDLLARFTYLISCFSVGNYIPSLSWVDRVSGLEARTKKVAIELDEFLEGVLEEQIYKNTMMDGEGNRNDKGQDLLDILLDLHIESNTSFMHRDVIKAGIMVRLFHFTLDHYTNGDLLVVSDELPTSYLFAAGTDTTSTSIEWAISELIRHLRVMKKLQKEVTEIAHGKPMITEDDLEKMTYLHAVLKEAL